jgi:broad specificity phosphatase PhoE
MRYLEVRRHTLRIKPNKHICQAGVMLARRVGEAMGPFDRVITSTAPRAFETALAMGFAADEQIEALSSYGDDVEEEIDHASDFEALARLVRKGKATARFARQQAKLWRTFAQALPDSGSVLMVSHGGVIEIGAIGCLPDADHATWGASLDYCEGVRLTFDGDDCVAVAATILRNTPK